MRATPSGLPVTLTTNAACRGAGAANDALATAPATTSIEARILAIARTRSRWGKATREPWLRRPHASSRLQQDQPRSKSVRQSAAVRRRVLYAHRFTAAAVKWISERAANSVCSLPPCGGGLGRGVASLATLAPLPHDPTPTPPHKGEESAPSVRLVCRSNRPRRGSGNA
jgi:hypothetical protein